VAFGATSFSVAAADVNGDGHLDLVAQSIDYTSQHAGTMLGHGDGTFSAPATFPSTAYSLVLCDLDRNGRPDFIGVNDLSLLVTRANLGDGSFGPRIDYGVAGSPSAAATGDLNGDGMPDLVAVGGDRLTVLLSAAPLGVGHTPPPGALALAAVAPNPNHGRMSLDFMLPHAGRARLELIDPAGRRAAAIADRGFAAGRQHLDWSPSGTTALRPGLYWMRLDFAGEMRSVKVVVLR
jgi:hypothetical protein